MPLDALNLGKMGVPLTLPRERVIYYIDGFNLYYGMKAEGWRRYYWLNVRRLAEFFLKDSQELVSVKYFTSRIKSVEDKRVRQNMYLDALESTAGIEVFYGQFYDQPFRCPHCLTKDRVPAEKMTDVNIATQMLVDAYQDRCDAAFVVSGDSDLVPPMRIIRDNFPTKRIVAAFPPNRTSAEIRETASGYFSIGKPALRRSQFPETVMRHDGFALNRPARWG